MRSLPYMQRLAIPGRGPPVSPEHIHSDGCLASVVSEQRESMSQNRSLTCCRPLREGLSEAAALDSRKAERAGGGASGNGRTQDAGSDGIDSLFGGDANLLRFGRDKRLAEVHLWADASCCVVPVHAVQGGG